MDPPNGDGEHCVVFEPGLKKPEPNRPYWNGERKVSWEAPAKKATVMRVSKSKSAYKGKRERGEGSQMDGDIW